jgi:hypothetical protein
MHVMGRSYPQDDNTHRAVHDRGADSRVSRGPTGASDPDILRFWLDSTSPEQPGLQRSILPAGACNMAIYPLKRSRSSLPYALRAVLRAIHLKPRKQVN